MPWSEAYLQLCVDGWAAEVAKRYGAETMAEIEWAAWNDQVVPELERMKNEFLPGGHGVRRSEPAGRRGRPGQHPGRLHRAVHAAARTPPSSPRSELVTWFLGSHEYLLQCIEAWATQITVRYGLDEMFDIQCTLWGDIGAARGEEAQGGVPRHHRQHRRGLDEGPPARRHRACRARRSTSPSRCPSPTSAS